VLEIVLWEPGGTVIDHVYNPKAAEPQPKCSVTGVL